MRHESAESIRRFCCEICISKRYSRHFACPPLQKVTRKYITGAAFLQLEHLELRHLVAPLDSPNTFRGDGVFEP